MSAGPRLDADREANSGSGRRRFGLGWGLAPGRNLVAILMVPAAISPVLFFRADLLPALLTVDAIILACALGDLLSLIGIGRSRFRFERSCQQVASLGEPQQVELSLENRTRLRRRMQIRDDVPETCRATPEQFAIRLEPGRRLILRYELRPLERGTVRFERVDAVIPSRLGLWQRAIRWDLETTLRVYPDVRQIARYSLLARKDRLHVLGLRKSRRVGTDNEFERLRDYILGDEPRHVDWKATARRTKLTVREFQANQSQRIIFLIDCGRMMVGDSGDGLSLLDHAFNAMLLLAHVALVKGDQVGLIAFDEQILTALPMRSGPSRINSLVHAVHDIFPRLVEPRYDRAFAELKRRYRKRSLVMLLTNVFDEVNAEEIRQHLGSVLGHHVGLAVFLRDRELFELADQGLGRHIDGASGTHRALEQDLRTSALTLREPSSAIRVPHDTEERGTFYRAAAAASMLNWRESVLTNLRHQGALTLDAFAEDLTARLVNMYLDIKAKHLL